MPKIPFPNKDPDSWDTVEFVLGSTSYVLPHCQVSATAENDIDVQKPKGKNGASVVFNGQNPAKIVVKAMAWENVDPLEIFAPQSNWELLQETILALRKFGDPFAISHPQAVMLGIKRVVLDSIKLSPPPEGGDRYEAEISLTEFAERSKDQRATESVTKRLTPQFAQQLAANIAPNALKPGTGP